MKKLDTTHQLFSPAEAEKVAKELQQGDPEWQYEVIHDPAKTGFSFIEIYDENGDFVENF